MRERGPICAKPYRHNIVIKFTSIVHTAENNTQIVPLIITLEILIKIILWDVDMAQQAYDIELINEILEFAIGGTQ